MEHKRTFSVGELTNRIKFVLEDGFDDIWVEGELSNVSVSARGHAYFSLKDASSVLNCAFFKGALASSGSELKDGLQVLVNGRISVYKPRGQYQLIVSKIEPKGEGALQLAFERLKKKLDSEGLFDPKKKKSLPSFPKHVAVVTSATGAAVRDIIKVMRRRNSAIRISVIPVLVQGSEAKDRISEAIESVNEYNAHIRDASGNAEPVDVMIVGRGGGSLEDLWAFNEEKVARAIYASSVPVVSAVGHEIDFTISDFVADLRAATPSAAAETVAPLKSDFENDIKDLLRSLASGLSRKISDAELNLNALKNKYVLREPMNFLSQLEQRLDEMNERCRKAIAYELKMRQSRFDADKNKLHALSPLGVLKRGYSITFKQGKVVFSSGSLKEKEKIRTRFHDGEVRSVVETVKENDA